MRLFQSPVIAALVLALSLTSTPAWGSTPPRYVALGDSYSAGAGSGGRETGGSCRRNANAFTARWAAAHRSYDAALVPCTGATAAVVRQSQLSALTGDTTLVTITVGGNDIGFAHAMGVCFVDLRGKDCLAGARAAADRARDVMPPQLRQLYADIRARAPRARVLVFGYPHVYRAGTGFCLGFDRQERAAVNNTIDALDAVIAQQATAAGVQYVEMRGAFTGHEVCGRHPWIIGPTVPTIYSFHPNEAGQRDGYLAALSAIAP